MAPPYKKKTKKLKEGRLLCCLSPQLVFEQGGDGRLLHWNQTVQCVRPALPSCRFILSSCWWCAWLEASLISLWLDPCHACSAQLHCFPARCRLSRSVAAVTHQWKPNNVSKKLRLKAACLPGWSVCWAIWNRKWGMFVKISYKTSNKACLGHDIWPPYWIFFALSASVCVFWIYQCFLYSCFCIMSLVILFVSHCHMPLPSLRYPSQPLTCHAECDNSNSTWKHAKILGLRFTCNMISPLIFSSL